MIVFSRWYGCTLCVRGLLIALYLRFDICEDSSNHTRSLAGAAAFSVFEIR
jgi:hypothetical protein